MQKRLAAFLVYILFIVLVSDAHASKHSGAHLILKKESETITYSEDGSHVDEDEVFLLVLDEQGRSEAQVQSFYVNRHYCHFKLKFLEIIKPDGRKLKIDVDKNSRWEAPRSDVEMNIYDPNTKVLKVFIPDLQPMDIVHYKIQRRVFKPIIPGQAYGMVVVQQDFPVELYRLRIILPKSKKLYFLVKKKAGEFSFKKLISKDKKEYLWCFKNIPMLVPEPNMVPFHRVAMRLLFSTIPSWQQVSKWYYRLVEPKLKPTQAIKKKVTELIHGKRDELEKIKALFYFVAQKIRYLGITAESYRPGFEPHDVSLTFTRKYGVCRDKAALLVCMLRIAGFRAAPVLISMGNKLDKEIVVPYFNHAIAAVLDGEGNPLYFLDPTSETSKQLLPDYDRNSSYLIADKRGCSLGTTPSNVPEKNLIAIRIKDKLNKDGSIEGFICVRASGFIDTVFRSVLLNKSYEEQKRFLIRFLEEKRKGLCVKEIHFSRPENRSVSFKFWAKFRINDSIASLKDRLLFWPVSASKHIGLLDKWILSKANLIKRKYPLRFGYVFADIWTEEIDLSDFKGKIKRLCLPVSLHTENEIYSFYSSFSFSPEKPALEINRYFSLKKPEVAVERYPSVTRLQHDMNYEYLFPVVIVGK
jgi:hypothetical protein